MLLKKKAPFTEAQTTPRAILEKSFFFVGALNTDLALKSGTQAVATAYFDPFIQDLGRLRVREVLCHNFLTQTSTITKRKHFTLQTFTKT